MTWQLAAFLLLGVGLTGGFAWYERTKPDAKIVALVGTLAAFAALGRIAFAAVPNVKPTTDIVLISGFALGGAPGYVVGAVAALTSNFFFGQGPWTPWQMAGWGLVGIIGAVLARASGGRIGRRSLAATCFAVGFAFTAFQDFGDWVTYSDHSLAQLGIYVGKGLGFDLIHATGCAAFALLFGPALLHSLRRFRRRLDVHWLPAPGAAAVPLLLVGLALAAAHGIEPPNARAAGGSRSPVQYLEAAQSADGGFGSAPGQSSNSMFAGWATMALAAAGAQPATLHRPGGSTASQYLERTVATDTDPGSIERTILALAAADANPATIRTTHLLNDLRKLIGADGSVSQQTNLTAFAILALRAARSAPPAKTVAWVIRQQDRDGGFNFATRGPSSDVDDTGAVLEAVARDPDAKRQISRAVAYIRSQQKRDGGFPDQQGGSSNAQSTAFAVQGLIAAGVNPRTLHRRQAPSPIAYLQSLIQPDGSIDYAKGTRQTPVWVTAEAELALAGRPLPVVETARPPRRSRPSTVAAKPRGHASATRPRQSDPLTSAWRYMGECEAFVLAPMGI